MSAFPDPEVTNREGQAMQVGAQLYLGYGPLTFGDTGRRNQQGRPVRDTVLNANPRRTAVGEVAEEACDHGAGRLRGGD